MITVNDAIEMMPKGWKLVSFNQHGDVKYEKSGYVLNCNRQGNWSCDIHTPDLIFCTQGIEKTPEAAIACVQEQITRRISMCAKLLSDLTGVEV
nr:MAG: hypothetical protein [Bacteriophage sp.]